MRSHSVQRRVLEISALALVFILFSSTVAPALLLAADEVTVTNSATAKSSTGGNQGNDGQSGQDGADGQDGTSGSDGSASTQGKSSARAVVETYVDGELVESKKTMSTTGPNATATVTTQNTSDSSTTSSTSSNTKNTPLDAEHSTSTKNALTRLADTLQSFLEYVGNLF